MTPISKNKVALSLSLSMFLGGCVSTGPDNLVINESGLMGAKVGFCSEVLQEDDVLRYFPLSASDSPEKRAQLKQEALEEWEETQQDAHSWLSEETFTVSQRVRFEVTEDDNDLFLGLDRGRVSAGRVSHENVIADQIYFSRTYRHAVPYYYPKYSVASAGNKIGTQFRVRDFIHAKYKNPESTVRDTLHIEQTVDTTYERVSSSSHLVNTIPDSMGIILKVPAWYDDTGSPIKKVDGEYSLALKEIDFNDAFEAYPDLYRAEIQITYTYNIDRCEGRTLYGDVQKVELWPIKYGQKNPSSSPLAVIKVN